MKTFEEILLEQRDKLHPLDDPYVDLERGIYDGKFAPCMEAIKIYCEQVAKDAFDFAVQQCQNGYAGQPSFEEWRNKTGLP